MEKGTKKVNYKVASLENLLIFLNFLYNKYFPSMNPNIPIYPTTANNADRAQAVCSWGSV